jgi:hypothetical protein
MWFNNVASGMPSYDSQQSFALEERCGVSQRISGMVHTVTYTRVWHLITNIIIMRSKEGRVSAYNQRHGVNGNARVEAV